MTQATATRERRIAEVDERLTRIDALLNDPVALADALYTILRERRAHNAAYSAATAVCAGLVAVLADLPAEARS